MDLLVTTPEQTHEIALVVYAAAGERDNVVDFLNRNHFSFTETKLAVGMAPHISVPNPFLRPAISLSCGGSDKCRWNNSGSSGLLVHVSS